MTIQTTTIFDDSGDRLEYFGLPICDFLQVMYSLHENALRGSNPGQLQIDLFDIEPWHAVTEKLQDLYRFLTGESVKIDFAKRSGEKPNTIIRLSHFIHRSEFSRVALFSGGADSGIYAALMSNNRNSTILSHTNTSRMLFGKARSFHERYASGSCKLAQSKAKLFERETATNTRALVILGNALAIAGELDIPKVIVPENGAMMINKPVSTRSAASMTSNPWMIEQWAQIFNQTTGHNTKVEAPFAGMTKAEVMLLFNDPQAISSTYSCFTSQSQARMCGLCHACIVRILSCYAAGIDQDTQNLFTWNWFSEEGKSLGFRNSEKLVIALDALEFWCGLLHPEKCEVPEESAYFANLNRLYPILHNHAMDMFLGVTKIVEKERWDAGPVGGRAIELLGKVDPGLLAQREEELMHFKESEVNAWMA